MSHSKRQYARNRVLASAVNGAATATITAPGQGRSIVVTSITLSASAAPAAAVTATLKENAVLAEQFEIPAANFPPITTNFTSPLFFGENLPVELSLPALGAGVRGTVVIRYYFESY